MPSTQRVAIYWEDSIITVFVSEKNQPIQSVSINPQDQVSEEVIGTESFNEIQQVAAIQKVLRELKIEGADAVIAIANKEIIIRSFMLPSLRPSEISAAINFEVKKHIPFDLNTIRYTYHVSNFIENNVKKLRVIFFAVKKDICEKYERIVSQTGLKVVSIEPISFGIAKYAQIQKVYPIDKKVALIDIDEHLGHIIIVDRGVVCFYRDFQWQTQNSFNEADDIKHTRIFNEIRNSLDYYQRQFDDRAEHIYIASPAEYLDWFKSIEMDLSAQGVKFYNLEIKLQDRLERSYTGFALAGLTGILSGSMTDLNFIPKVEKRENFSFEMPSIDWADYIPVIQTVVIMLVLFLGFWGYVGLQSKELQKQLDTLIAQEGEYAPSANEDIQQRINQIGIDENEYKKIKFKSQTSQWIILMLSYMPEGMWLEDFNVSLLLDKGQLDWVMKGKVWREDVNEEIKLVNEFVNQLRQDKMLTNASGYFRLKDIRRDIVNQQIVMSFSVNSERKND